MKKILSAIIAASMLTSCITAIHAEEKISNDNYAFAYEGIDYPVGTVLMNYDCNGGTGFTGKWYAGSGSFAGDRPSISDVKGSAFLSNYKSNVKLRRDLEKPIDLSVDGEYYMTLRYRDTANNQATPLFDTRFCIGSKGNENIYGGLYYDSVQNGYFVSGSLEGEKVLGDIKRTFPQVYNDNRSNFTCIWDFVINLSVKANGEDTLRVKMWREDLTETDNWDIEIAGEAGSGTLDFLQITNNGHGVCTDEMYIEQLFGDNAGTVSDTIHKIEKHEDVTLEECQQTVEVLSNVLPCSRVMLDRTYNKVLKPYIESKGWGAQMPRFEVTASNVRNGDTVEELNKIEINTNLTIFSGSANLVGNFGIIDSDVEINGNTVTIIPKEELMPDSEYLIRLSDIKDFRGETLEDINFRTWIMPVISMKDGESYGEGSVISWQEDENVKVTATDGDNEITNGYKFSVPGSYKLTFTAESGDVTATKVINIVITEAFAPEAKNVRITGEAFTGSTIKGEYEFTDKNGEKEGESRYRWLRADSENGNYEEIDGAEALEYKLTEADENKYVKFAVTPVAVSDMRAEGAEILSGAFAGAFCPEAKNVRISGKCVVSEVLKAEYEFYDKNGDAENETKIVWYVSDSENGEFRPIDNENKEFTISSDLTDKFVKVGVTPVSDKAPNEGKEVFSSVMTMPQKPQIIKASVSGTPTVGYTLSASYVYFDPNGDEEEQSQIRWEDSNGNLLGTGMKLTLTSAHAGKSVRIGVVGKSINEPYESDIFYSAYVTVRAESKSSGGGGNGGKNSGSFAVSAPNSGSQKPEVKEENPVQEKKYSFSDISSHWAKDSIEELKTKGLVEGYDDGRFMPDTKTSYAQFLAMLLRAANVEEKEYKGELSGVAENAWYAGYYQAAYEAGYIEGLEELMPDDEIEREDMALLIDRVFALEATSTELDCTDKENISPEKAESVSKAYANGILVGYTDGEFKPKATLTRAEAVAVIGRLLDKEGEASDEK